MTRTTTKERNQNSEEENPKKLQKSSKEKAKRKAKEDDNLFKHIHKVFMHLLTTTAPLQPLHSLLYLLPYC